MRPSSQILRRATALLAGALVLSACANAVSVGSTANSTASPPTSADGGIAVTVSHTVAGEALSGMDGMTLYILTKDHDGTSSCTTGSCASYWHALKGDASQISPGAGVSGSFGTTTWTNGTKQVTYNGQPLYYYSGDDAAGDANGQRSGGVWFIALVDGPSGSQPHTDPGQSTEPSFRAPGPAIHASENSDGEY